MRMRRKPWTEPLLDNCPYVIDLPTTVIFVLVFLGSVLFDVSPAVYVVLAGIAGILLKNFSAGKGGK